MVCLAAKENDLVAQALIPGEFFNFIPLGTISHEARFIRPFTWDADYETLMLFVGRHALAEIDDAKWRLWNGLYLNSKMHSGLQFTAAYTFSHSLDNSSGALGTGTNGGGMFLTSTGVDFRANYGNSDQDQRQVSTFSALGELSFGWGKIFLSNVLCDVNEATGGWRLNVINTMESGTPATVTTGNYLYAAPGGNTSLVGSGMFT